MKPLKRKLTSSLALFVVLSATQLASAFYDPSAGRWLSRDPIGERGGENLFGIVRNDVVNRIDLLGLWEVDCKACGGCRGQTDIKGSIDSRINALIAAGKTAAQIAASEAGDPGLRNLTPPIEQFAENSPGASIPTSGSTKYKGLNGMDGIIGIRLSRCVLLCGQCIGADKIGHLFQQGWEYYNISVLQGKGDGLAESYGAWLEGAADQNNFKSDEAYFKTQPSGGKFGYGGYGLKPSGVISYGDLAANKAGLQMYKDIAAGTFKTICSYISKDLDEDINLNAYRDDVDAVVRKNGGL